MPKSAVSYLKVWLFEHFEHPYPSDEEKAGLSKQTNLTLTQVNNWFINARRRIWRPIIEQQSKNRNAPLSPSPIPNAAQNKSKLKFDKHSRVVNKAVNEYFNFYNRKEWEKQQGIGQPDNIEDIHAFQHYNVKVEEKANLARTIEEIQRENEFLKAEFARLSKTYEDTYRQFSLRNAYLLNQIIQAEEIQKELKNQNLEMSRKLLSLNKKYPKVGSEMSAFKPVIQKITGVKRKRPVQ